MSRPRLLDLFCCAGGAAMGYHRAGFEVTGVDIKPQPDYPFGFWQTDVLEYLDDHLGVFDAIHASPPCQGYSTITPDKSKHPKLINQVREIIEPYDIPYVIENVPGAKAHLRNPVRLCGSSFGLAVRRHRLFESNIPLTVPPCAHSNQAAVGVYGSHPDSREYLRPDGTRRGRKARSLEEAQSAMGIDWMDWTHLKEAIPPAYTEHIGRQLIDHMREVAA